MPRAKQVKKTLDVPTEIMIETSAPIIEERVTIINEADNFINEAYKLIDKEMANNQEKNKGKSKIIISLVMVVIIILSVLHIMDIKRLKATVINDQNTLNQVVNFLNYSISQAQDQIAKTAPVTTSKTKK